MAARSRKKRRVAEERPTLIGQSAAFLELVRRVDAVAPTESTVLLSGEAGVGKTLIATAIHDRSARRGRPAVVVDAAAVQDIRSALFGRKGGALARVAKGGTIIFEEVGQLDMEIQARLLQWLDTREFIPEHSRRSVHTDARVIATTNVDLTEGVEAGWFRAELLVRLNVCALNIPPLRDRPEDIPILARYYLECNARKFGKQIRDFSPRALVSLMRYPWPGNVRELSHNIQRAVVRCTGSFLEVEPDPSKAEWTDEAERQYIRALIKSTNGVIGGPHGAAVLYGYGLRPRVPRSVLKWFRAMGSPNCA
jgi:DNA-binding NtrC family response regulator